MQVSLKPYACCRYALGDPCNPLSIEQLEERFHQLTAPVLPDQQQRVHIIQKVRHLAGVGRTGYFMDEGKQQPGIFPQAENALPALQHNEVSP